MNAQSGTSSVKTPLTLKRAVEGASKYFLLYATVAVTIVFGIMQPQFLSFNNMMSIIRTASVIGLMACGNMLVMSTGGINFAMGAQITVCGAIIGRIMEVAPDWFYFGACIIAILCIMVTGGVAGLFTIRFGVPAFIATLALNTVLMGLSRVLTRNTTLFSNKWGGNFSLLGQSMIGGKVPVPIILFIVISVIVHIFYEKTRLGRNIFAVGAGPTTCRQVGINVDRTRCCAFIFGAGLVAMAGILDSSITRGVVLTAGSELFPQALCATMLSATFLTPGKFNVPGIFVASIMTILIQNGVISVGGSFFMKDLILGVILVLAITVIAIVRKEGLPAVTFGS